MRRRLALLALPTLALIACARPSAPPARPSAVTLTSAATPCSGIHLAQGFDVVVLGSGGPRSAGRAASSVLVAFDGVPRILVDAGPGAFVRLGESQLSAEALDTILLTHLHVDHTGDVPALVKSRDLFGQGPVTFRVFGPSARGAYPSTSAFVDRLFGREGAFAYLPEFRNPLRIESVDLPNDPNERPRTVFEERGVVVSAVGVDHGDVPALAYRIERAGRALVVTGDLASRHARIVELARNADVLVYDTAVLDPPGSPKNLYDLHTPPSRIGEIARDADVKHLVLSHIPPLVEKHREEVLASVRRSFLGDVRFAHDCLHVPVGGP